MTGNSPDYYGRILVILLRLKELYPNIPMSQHILAILPNDNISDREFLKKLQEYKNQL